MLDLQRFQQYVAEEQSKYMENHAPPLLTGHGIEHVPPHSVIDAGQATVPSTAGGGCGLEHVALHGSIAVGQATIPSIVGTKINDEETSGVIHVGRASDHVTAHGGMAAGTDHSQPPSFLSQESANTVVAGGPNFVKPGTAYKH